MPKQFKKADWKCNLSHFQSAALFLSVTGLKPTDQFQVTGLIRIKLTGRHLRNFRHIPGASTTMCWKERCSNTWLKSTKPATSALS